MNIKKYLKPVFFYGGLPHAKMCCRRITGRQKIFILMFHRVAREPAPYFESVITPDIFDRQIRFLKRNYNIISLNETGTFEHTGKREKDIIIITFDDGYRDNFTNAFPILKKHEVPATVFLTTDYIDTNRLLWFDDLAWILYNSRIISDRNAIINDIAIYEIANECGLIPEGERNNSRHSLCSLALLLKYLPMIQRDMFIKKLVTRYMVDKWPDETSRAMLSWNEIKEMAGNNISFGGHTKTHPVLSAIPLNDARVEIAGSKKIIEDKLQKAVTTFAYPFGKKGDYTDSVVAILKSEGIENACTTNRGAEKYPIESPLTLKRLGVASSPYLFF